MTNLNTGTRSKVQLTRGLIFLPHCEWFKYESSGDDARFFHKDPTSLPLQPSFAPNSSDFHAYYR